MADKVLTSVSPSLHPDSVLPFSKAGDVVVKSAQSALRGMYVSLDLMQNLEQSTRQEFGVKRVVDGANTFALSIPHDKAVILHADLGTRFATVARGFDVSLGQINDQITALQGRVDKSLVSTKRDAVSGNEFSDIRRYVSTLDPNKRMDFLHSAINAGDVDVVHACVASPWASGLSREQVEVVRDLASKKFATADVEQLGAARATHTHLLAASATFLAKYKTLLPNVVETPSSVATKALKTEAA
jgi:hypothetical protein